MKYSPGKQMVSAVYDNNGSKNPLIEALPERIPMAEFWERIGNFPPAPIECADLTITERMRNMAQLQSVFIPLSYIMSFLTPTVAASVFDATVKVRQIEQVLAYLSRTAFDPYEDDPGVIPSMSKCEAELICNRLLRELAHNYKNVIRRATEKVSVAVRDPLICNLIITPEEIYRAINFAAVDQDWESKMHFSRKTKAEIVFTVLDNVVNATIDRTQSVWENDEADEEIPGDSGPSSDDL